MKFVPVKDLRSNIKQIRQRLGKEKEMVLTFNGKPFAILSAVSGDTLEEDLAMLRQFRAYVAMARLQGESMERGNDRISLEDINTEIAAVRKGRR
jgi:hypothetical protein